jgi:hypothetical protein
MIGGALAHHLDGTQKDKAPNPGGGGGFRQSAGTAQVDAPMMGEGVGTTFTTNMDARRQMDDRIDTVKRVAPVRIGPNFGDHSLRCCSAIVD